MIKIESKDNKIFKETRKLKERKWRNKSKKYLIEGMRIVEEAIKSGVKIDCIFVSEYSTENENIKKILESTNSNSFILSDELFNIISDTENSQGIIASVYMNGTNDYTDKKNSMYILVDKVQDPGNLGTIIRTAHAAGADGVILTKGTVDLYNEKTIRSTMGSIFYINVFEDNDLSYLNTLKEKGYKLIVSSLKESKDFFMEDLSGNVIITVGNEGNGVSEEIEAISDVRIKIPMPGNAESLNVSVAASIMIYEKVRQNIINVLK